MKETFQQRLAHQLEVTFRSGSTYVVIVIGALATLYASLTTGQQESLLSTLPFLKGYTPIIAALAAFLATRMKPSNAVSTQTQALIDELARLKTNQLLKAAGQPEIPPPAATIPIPPATKPDPMNVPFKEAAGSPVDIPLPLGTQSQPIHIILHQS